MSRRPTHVTHPLTVTLTRPTTGAAAPRSGMRNTSKRSFDAVDAMGRWRTTGHEKGGPQGGGRIFMEVLGMVFVFLISSAARADPPVFSDQEILDEPSYFRLRSFGARYTRYEQNGEGFQSRAGLPRGPGSQQATIDQPQLEAVIEQGDDIVHRFWLPVDVVTAASPDAVDIVSTASRTNEAGAIDWAITYGETTPTPLTFTGGFHAEENYRSYSFGLSSAVSLADDNTVLQANGTQLLDWFDRYQFSGKHDGHAPRAATHVTVGLTQVLSPWTIVYLDYGITYQQGQLSNGWNTVPFLGTGPTAGRFLPDTRMIEVLPPSRARSAATARVAEWLPWNGALKASYRFYADDWDIFAHSAEFELDQRLHPYFYIGATYRFHTQSGASFYQEAPTFRPRYRTADSDLQAFDSHTVGGKGGLDMPFPFFFANRVHMDLAVERYARTNNLEVMVYSFEMTLLR